MGINRREFLRKVGQTGVNVGVASGIASIAPFEQLLGIISQDLIRSARAEAAGQDPGRNYLNIYLDGGPNRFVFDQWIRTSNDDLPLHFNPMTATAFSGGSGITGEYRTMNYRGYNVPHLFSQSVNLSSGVAPIAELLDNMMVIRGYGTDFDGHAFNAMAQMAPLGGTDTISALSANQSTRTFEAIQWPGRGSSSVFNSTKGKALTQLTGANPLNTLVEGFAPPDPSFSKSRSLKDRQVAAFAHVNAQLKAFADSGTQGSQVMSQNLQNARALMKKGVNGVTDYWAPAVARYRNVVFGALRTLNIPGISDRPLFRSSNDVSGYFGIRLAANADKIVAPNFDIRDMLVSAEIQFLAEGLALAEYCFSESLVTSIEAMAANIVNLFLPLEGDLSTTIARTADTDMHGTGKVPALFLMNGYYRGLSAGLLELIRVLKSKTVGGQNLWSQTVIHVHGDFARRARSSGSGSDHGFNQMVTSVFSGAMTQGPYVVGNIKRGTSAASGTGYLGSQGIGAPIAGYNQQGRPTPQMAASTICELLGVSKNPYKNGALPLAQFENNIWTVKFPGKVIEGA